MADIEPNIRIYNKIKEFERRFSGRGARLSVGDCSQTIAIRLI